MGKGIVRLGDEGTGHGCFPARPCDTASNNVFVNGKGAVRVGDHWVKHCCGSCHDGTQSTGSSSVFANGKAIARQGDKISCGSKNDECSNNVFAGG